MELLKNWKIFAIILLVVALIVWWIYAQGKKAATGPQVDLPGGANAIPAGWSPEPLAKELHDAMDSLLVFADTKETAFKKLFELPTDAMIVAVYNAFGKLYFSEGYGTLTEWIRDESNYVPELLGGVRARLLSKLQSLNLS